MTPNELALWNEGQQHIVDGRLPAAQAALESLLESNPWLVPARLLLASVFLAQGRVRAGAEQAKFAAFALPDDADTIHRVAQCLVRVGETNAARACLQHPEVARTRNAPALAALAHICQALGLHAPALAMMDRAKALGYDTADFRYFRAIQLQFNGRLAEAEAEMEACLKQGPTYGRASLTLARLHRQREDSNHLDFIRARLASVPTGTEDHAGFEFALYKELEDLGRLDEAWAALQRANAIMHARLGYDPATMPRLVDGLIAQTPPSFLAASDHRLDGPVPIFIVGMPRSGTTLLERILSGHSQVASAGELADFPRQLRWVADQHGHELIDDALVARLSALDYAELGRRYLEQTQWRAEGKAFFVDKLPANYQVAGLIRRALPQARILHMRREPMDVCFSNYRALFGDAFAYSYDLAALANHYRQYRRLMAHWQMAMPGAILDIPYPRLVQDTDAMAREILDFCGLPFEAGCVDTGSNRAAVATLSSVQVREPIHARTLGEWRRYERPLQPLQDLIGDL